MGAKQQPAVDPGFDEVEAGLAIDTAGEIEEKAFVRSKMDGQGVEVVANGPGTSILLPEGVTMRIRRTVVGEAGQS